MKIVLISIALVVICMIQYGDAQITAWTSPTITGAPDGTGTLTFPEDEGTGDTSTTFTASPTGADTITGYSLSPAGTPFSLNGAVLSIDSALDYETTESYTLEITVTDSAGNTGVATITVTVTNVNEAPEFASTQYAATVPDTSMEGTAVTTVTATDVDASDTITYSITGGNTNTDFAIDGTTGAITVASTKTLAAGTLAGYTLEITATDGGSPGLTDTTEVWIAVTDCTGSGAGVVVASLLSLFVAFSVVLY